MSTASLLSKKRIRVEFYLAPGVSVTNPEGPYEVDGDETLEELGTRFMQDANEPAGGPMDELVASWAVLKGEKTVSTFGSPSLPMKLTGLFAELDVGAQLILIPRGRASATIGFEEVFCPVDMDGANCCVVSYSLPYRTTIPARC
ncbi:hypothetical protein DIPPA_23744 [Diplonema papillatum]|nr:hypothetical protein DIPPA_23744 [Diplonema papillatum]